MPRIETFERCVVTVALADDFLMHQITSAPPAHQPSPIVITVFQHKPAELAYAT